MNDPQRGATGVKLGLIARIHTVTKQMAPTPLTTQEIADLLNGEFTEQQVRSTVVSYTGRQRKKGEHAIIEYDRSSKLVGWVGLKRGPKPRPRTQPDTQPGAQPKDAGTEQPQLSYEPVPTVAELADQYEALRDSLRTDPNPRLRTELLGRQPFVTESSVVGFPIPHHAQPYPYARQLLDAITRVQAVAASAHDELEDALAKAQRYDSLKKTLGEL